jgi:pyridoxal/pyridoxine/pyridoxamine kinase
LKSPHIDALTYASPNLAELRMLAGSNVDEEVDAKKNLNDLLRECVDMAESVLDKIPFLVVTLGDRGVLVSVSLHFLSSSPTKW